MKIEDMDLKQFADFLGVLVPLAHELGGGDKELPGESSPRE